MSKFSTFSLLSEEFTPAQIAFIESVEADYDSLVDLKADYADELAELA